MHQFDNEALINNGTPVVCASSLIATIFFC
jgi:hypothetical protein